MRAVASGVSMPERMTRPRATRQRTLVASGHGHPTVRPAGRGSLVSAPATDESVTAEQPAEDPAEVGQRGRAHR